MTSPCSTPPARASVIMTVIEFPVGTAASTPPRLMQRIAGYRFNPLGFVLFAFPWVGRARRSPARAAPSRGSARYWSNSAAA